MYSTPLELAYTAPDLPTIHTLSTLIQQQLDTSKGNQSFWWIQGGWCYMMFAPDVGSGSLICSQTLYILQHWPNKRGDRCGKQDHTCLPVWCHRLVQVWSCCFFHGINNGSILPACSIKAFFVICCTLPFMWLCSTTWSLMKISHAVSKAVYMQLRIGIWPSPENASSELYLSVVY